MELYIANGVDVNPSWTTVIAVSKDGDVWETISKEGLSVHPRIVSMNVKSPLTPSDRPTQTRIALKAPGGEVRIDFELQNVSSGASAGQHTGWQAGTKASLITAVDEINTWLT